MKKNIIKAVIIIIVAVLLFFLLKALYEIVSKFTIGEELFEEKTTVVGKTPAPLTKEAVVDYFNTLSDKVKAQMETDGMPEVSAADRFDVSKESIQIENKEFDTLFKRLTKNIVDGQKSAAHEKVLFPNTKHAYPAHIDPSDVALAVCDNGDENYTLTIFFKEKDEAAAAKYFNPIKDEDIKKGIETAQTYLTVNDYKLENKESRIICTVNKATDEISMIIYQNIRSVSVKAEGAGTFESSGKLDFSFELDQKTVYSMKWQEEVKVTE